MLHLSDDALLTHTRFEFGGAHALRVQQRLVETGLEFPVALKVRNLVDHCRQFGIANAVAAALRARRQQRLPDQTFYDHLLHHIVDRTTRIRALKLFETPAVRLLADFHSVDFGHGRRGAAAEIRTDAPENERYGHERENQRGDDALGLFTNLGEHVSYLPT